MNINDIAEKAYNNADRLGKLGDRTDIEKLKDLQSEYMEAFKALNNKNHERFDLFDGMIRVGGDFVEAFEGCIKDSYEDELTDCLFVILTLMKDNEMDIGKHIEAKMKYNELRDDHK